MCKYAPYIPIERQKKEADIVCAGFGATIGKTFTRAALEAVPGLFSRVGASSSNKEKS